jgi:hypothetical protein
VTPFCNTWDILGLLYVEEVIILFTRGIGKRQWDKSMEECGELLEKNKLRRKKNEM